MQDTVLDVEFTRFGDAHSIISAAIDGGREVEVSIISKVDAEELARKCDSLRMRSRGRS